MFTKETNFAPGSISRELAYELAHTINRVLSQARLDWQYSSLEEVCEISGLTPEIAWKFQALVREFVEDVE